MANKPTSIRTYDPPDLEQRIESAIHIFERVTGEEREEFLPAGMNSICTDQIEGDDPISAATEVMLTVPRVDDYHVCDVQGLLDLAEELDSAEVVGKMRYYSRNRALVRTEPRYTTETGMQVVDVALDAEDDDDDDESSPSKVSVVVQGVDCTCKLVNGITPFAFAIMGNAYWDKHYPPVGYDEVYVEVTWNGKLDRSAIDLLADAYLFEIASTWGVSLMPCARHDPIFIEDDIDLVIPPLRTPSVIKHAHAVYRLFTEAESSYDDSISIMLYAKVFEHISYTVVRSQLISRARKKLLTPGALSPTADFIFELESIFSEHRIFKKDREAIQLTVCEACEAVDLAHVAPNCIPALRKISIESNPKDRESALKSLALCLVDTRNQIAHAKSNYEATGLECPEDQLPALRKCLSSATQQAVRWFGDLPPSVVQ